MAIGQLTARSAYVPPPEDYTANMILDWATNIDESIGPVPSASDFCPTKALSPLLSPNLAPCSPDNPITPAKPVRILTAPTSLRDVFVFAKPDHTSTKTTATSITGETAPHVNAAHFPTSLSKPGMDRHPKGSGEPPSPLASPQLAPSPHVRDLSSNQRGHVTPSKQCAPLKPTVTLPNSDVATKTVSIGPTPVVAPLIEPDFSDVACAPSPDGVALTSPLPTELAPINTGPNASIGLPDCIPAVFEKFEPLVQTATVPPTAHEPRDFSALRSGKQNPWGSIRHRHYCSQPVHRNLTRSPNIHQYPHSRPLHFHYPNLPSRNLFKLLIHSNLLPPNPYHTIPSTLPLRNLFNLQSNSYSHQAPAPANIIQTIQHPHGISSTKLKITKTIQSMPQLPAAMLKEPSIAQCACGCNIVPLYPHNQSRRFADTRRLQSRRIVGTWRKAFWDRERGYFDFGRDIQAWGPRFTERGYMDQLRWSRLGFGSGFGCDRR
jgi:hypothetical protein